MSRKNQTLRLPSKTVSVGFPDDFTCFVRTSFEECAAFESSDPILNKLCELTKRSYESNFTGIPTDCPHREKNGWTGDAFIATETGLFFYRSAPAYASWLQTIHWLAAY